MPITTEEALAAESEVGLDQSEAPEVERWLRETLADGPVPAKQVLKSCKDAGFSCDQAKRAKKRLRVRGYKEGFAPDVSRWVWALPENASSGDEQAKGARRERREQGE